MNSKIISKNTDTLFQAILTLKTVEECYAFFDDLCTVPEIKAMTQRFAVARMLSEGEIYNEIVAQTGASTATISRVNRALHYGSDGYTLTIQRMNSNEDNVEVGDNTHEAISEGVTDISEDSSGGEEQ